MDAVKYLEEKGRMCSSGTCHKCKLSSDCNGKNLSCIDFQKEYPEVAVEIVEKWAKENPVKTYNDVLLEKFPNAKMYKGYSVLCVKNIFGEHIISTCVGMTCKDCWNKEYEEGRKEVSK